MNNLFLILVIMIFNGISLNAQVESDVIKIADNNCMTDLGKNYMISMGIYDSSESDKVVLRVRELLKKSKFEEKKNGVFLISNLSAHRKNLIALKKDNEIKLLTFNDISQSMLELISFLNNIETNDEDLMNYIDAIQSYIEYSKTTIKIKNTIGDSDWINCK